MYVSDLTFFRRGGQKHLLLSVSIHWSKVGKENTTGLKGV